MIRSFFIILLTIIGCHLMAQNLGTAPSLPSYLIPNYNDMGRKLPPGVPRVIDTNGIVIYVPHNFTTKQYQDAAFGLVLQEANRVAKELKLPEHLPITESNVVEYHIGPFGFNYAYRSIGFVATSNYIYNVSIENKFSNLSVANYDQRCLKYKEELLPIAQIDTNAAYQLASQWLAAASMDVKSLNQDCRVKVEIDHFWNGIVPGKKMAGRQFVPIYDVWWLSPKDETAGRDTAYVQFFAPTRTLLQLSVRNSKYNLRKPLVFTNLAALFPGVAPIYTNHPVKTTYPPPPRD